MPGPSRRRSKRRNLAEIEEILGDLEQSGLSQQAFAARRGIPLSTLTWWRRRSRRESQEAFRSDGTSQGELVPVIVTEPEEAGSFRARGLDSRFEVRLRSGHAVSVPLDFDAASLGRLVNLLDRSC